MESVYELNSELELSKEELAFIISENFDIHGDKNIILNSFNYCYEIIKKYLKDNGGSHENLFSAVYTAASDISSNIFFAEFTKDTGEDLEMRREYLKMKCKNLDEIIYCSIETACGKVDKHKVYGLIKK